MMSDWIFPVPTKVRDIEGEFASGVSKRGLLTTLFVAVDRAWKEAIQPRMEKIRRGNLDGASMKAGNDFFTEADIESEKLIIRTIVGRFGENAFRIWAEEQNSYTGNLDSDLTIRIDPIDGTEMFKFGKPHWSIMIGIYTGRDSEEHQVLSTVFYPEYFNEVMYRIDGVGIFISNLTTGETDEIDSLDSQNILNEILTEVARSSDIKKRGAIDAIIQKLEEAGARVKSSSPIEAKEALQTRGRRAILTNGGFGQQDYIEYSALGSLGYKAYDWSGIEYNIDDPNLAGKNIALVPPGKAGKEIMEIIKSVV